MDCRILREISIKSDGHIHCDDSLGYGIHLGLVGESSTWNIKRILNGPIYQHVRRSFARGVPPWEETCRGCDLFNEGGIFKDTLDQKITLRIEPTLDCELACSFCMRKKEARARVGDWFLSIAKLKQFLSSCRFHKIDIDMVSYLGWGEPLSHPNFRGLVETVREFFPRVFQEVTTVAQADFQEVLADVAIDLITISCDGIQQASYEQYRKNGDIGKVFKFMEDSKKYKSKHTKIIWKYILFSYNDEKEDLIQAQRLTEEYEIDELHFIITTSANGSTKYNFSTINNFPLISDKAMVVPAAAFKKVMHDFCNDSFERNLASDSTKGYLDKLILTNANMLICEGWILSRSDKLMSSIRAGVNDGEYYRAVSVREKREDVARDLGKEQLEKCGFVLQIPFSQADVNHFILNITFQDADNNKMNFNIDVRTLTRLFAGQMA